MHIRNLEPAIKEQTRHHKTRMTHLAVLLRLRLGRGVLAHTHKDYAVLEQGATGQYNRTNLLGVDFFGVDLLGVRDLLAPGFEVVLLRGVCFDGVLAVGFLGRASIASAFCSM